MPAMTAPPIKAGYKAMSDLESDTAGGEVMNVMEVIRVMGWTYVTRIASSAARHHVTRRMRSSLGRPQQSVDQSTLRAATDYRLPATAGAFSLSSDLR